MGRRLQLQALLREVLDSEHVYFQPPSNLQMKYPCIMYDLDGADNEFADNAPFRVTKRYQVTYVDQDPDSDVPDRIARLPMTRLDRAYTADDLNHTVFTLFF